MKRFLFGSLFVAVLLAANPELHAQTKIADVVKNKLVALQGATIAPFDSAKLNGVQYYALYFSASWCPPCRAFTPKLVAFYNRIKPLHRNFELIFSSQDESTADAQKYIKSDHMKWPAIRFAQLSQTKAIQRYCGPGIPCLVFVDANGKVIYDSYVNKKYVGPSLVMNQIEAFLKEHPAGPVAAATPAPFIKAPPPIKVDSPLK